MQKWFRAALALFFAKVVDSKLLFDPPVDGKSGRVLYTEAGAERPAPSITEGAPPRSKTRFCP